MNVPKIEVVDFGSNCRLGVCLLRLICFWFYVYLILFNAYYHWWICFLVWLLSSFYIYIYIFFLFLFLWVCMCMLLCVIFVCIDLLLTFVLGFCLFIFFVFFNFVLFCFSLPFLLSSVAGRVLVCLAGCWAWAFKVGGLSPGHWTTRNLLTPWNISWQEFI